MRPRPSLPQQPRSLHRNTATFSLYLITCIAALVAKEDIFSFNKMLLRVWVPSRGDSSVDLSVLQQVQSSVVGVTLRVLSR